MQSNNPTPLHGDERIKLVKAFEEAKQAILEIYKPTGKENDGFDQAANLQAKALYGDIIDEVISEVGKHGVINSILKRRFELAHRDEPSDSNIYGEGRMMEYWKRFDEKAIPLLNQIPVVQV